MSHSLVGGGSDGALSARGNGGGVPFRRMTGRELEADFSIGRRFFAFRTSMQCLLLQCWLTSKDRSHVGQCKPSMRSSFQKS